MARGDPAHRALLEISRKLEQALSFARGEDPGPLPPLEDLMPPAPTGPGRAPQAYAALARLARSGHQREALESAADAVMAAIGAARGFVLTIKDERSVNFGFGLGVDVRFLQDPANGAAKAVVERVLRQREPLFFADAKAAGLAERPHSCLGFPFITQDTEDKEHMVALLYLEGDDASWDIELFESGCDILTVASAALTRIDLRSEATDASMRFKHSEENLTKLLEVGRRIASTLEVNELLELIVDKSLEVTRADRGYLMLIEGEEKKPAFKIGRTWNKKLGEERRSMALKEDQFFFSRSIIRRVIAENRSVCVKDTMADDSDNVSSSMVQMELQSVMCAPLRDKGAVSGLIYVDSRASNKEFTTADLELFEALAGQAAISLKNAQLYAQVGEKERMNRELELASSMQEDLLPKVVPEVAGLEMAGVMRPAKEVGGDYFDFMPDPREPDKEVTIVVGDVSGKGLGAGIVAVMARCYLRSMFETVGGREPQKNLLALNRVLAADLKPGQFMTMIISHWFADRRVLRYASAGHEHILHYRGRTGKVEATRSGGMALGLVETGITTEDREIHLAPGDTIVLYSDGVTEAMNQAEEEYELDRLTALVESRAGASSARELVEVIESDVAVFRGRAEQSDDITIVVLRCR